MLSNNVTVLEVDQVLERRCFMQAVNGLNSLPLSILFLETPSLLYIWFLGRTRVMALLYAVQKNWWLIQQAPINVLEDLDFKTQFCGNTWK